MQELLKKLSLRELRLVILGIGAIVVVALAASMLTPRVKMLIAAKQEVELLHAAAVNSSELERHLQEENQRIEDLRYRLYGDMADLPIKQVEAYIIGRLQEISWGTGVDLLSVQPATGEQVQIFQEMLFNIELIGEYDELYRWLWDVRNELGYVVIKEYSLSRRDDDDEEPVLAANLSLASYRAVQ